jgi:hypothetical protein
VPTTTISATGGLGPIVLEVPARRLSLTPASLVCVEAVGLHRGLLAGIGIDWGSGSGCLAIAAALVPTVERVVGVEIEASDVARAAGNARRNGVADKAMFVEADGFVPVHGRDRAAVAALEGRCSFLLANPPASEGDDGLGWRRRALADARRFLVPGAVALVQVSYQYGAARIRGLAGEASGYSYEGVLHSTQWVPFDQRRADLAAVLEAYAAEEARGGVPYAFADPASPGGRHTATRALAAFRAGGPSPLSKWQVHLYRRAGGPDAAAGGD